MNLGLQKLLGIATSKPRGSPELIITPAKIQSKASEPDFEPPLSSLGPRNLGFRPGHMDTSRPHREIFIISNEDTHAAGTHRVFRDR